VSLHEPFVWVVVLSTVIGLALSFTRVRTLDGAGASKIGTLLLYFLIACIGMQMDIMALLQRPELFLLGLVWISIHIGLLWLAGKLLRVPFFYFAIGSQSNIGGPASAPVVASVFHPSLAPVGALLGTLGYATGTGLAYALGLILKSMAGAWVFGDGTWAAPRGACRDDAIGRNFRIGSPRTRPGQLCVRSSFPRDQTCVC
jgi:uncharacterized membrane protein